MGAHQSRAPHRSHTSVMTARLALLYLVAGVYWIALSFVCGVVVERMRYEAGSVEVRERLSSSSTTPLVRIAWRDDSDPSTCPVDRHPGRRGRAE
jgi:hypothetical protein